MDNTAHDTLHLAAFFSWHALRPHGTADAPFAGAYDAFPVVVAVFISLSKYKTDIMQVIGVCALLGLAYSLFM